MAKKKVTYVFGADLSDLEKKLNKVQRKMSRMGKKMQAVGRSMTQKFTLPLVGLGAAAVTAGARFEKSMSGVEAVTGAAGTKLEEMTALARKMGETTEWSASQAAEGMRYLGMAGFE